MSEERKIINQCLSFTGNMTISELVTSIPNDFRGVVEISEGDLIITDEDVLNFGYKDIRLFNELRIINGYLKQEISDDLKKGNRAISLIIMGDFLCDESVLVPNFELSVRGIAVVLGEELKAGSIEVIEDLYCSGNITVDNGTIIVIGDLEVNKGMIFSTSSIDVRGDLTSDCICTESLTVRGDVSAYSGGIEVQNDVDIRGNLECSEIRANNINVRGNLFCDSSIKSKGTIYVGGDVEAEEIIAGGNLIIRGQANVPGRIDLPLNDVEIGKIAGNIINVNCKNLEIG